MTENEATDLLDLESRMTIAARTDCKCAPYFASRRRVLIPEVLQHAEKVGTDPVDLFAAFARGVHARHLSGLSLAMSA